MDDSWDAPDVPCMVYGCNNLVCAYDLCEPHLAHAPFRYGMGALIQRAGAYGGVEGAKRAFRANERLFMDWIESQDAVGA